MPTYEFAYNNSVNPSTGETPFFLAHGRRPLLPIEVKHKTRSPAVEDFVTNLQNKIAAARDHIRMRQASSADARAKKFDHYEFKAGDQVLLKAANYDLKLASEKLGPRWIGPLKVIQIRGPNLGGTSIMTVLGPLI